MTLTQRKARVAGQPGRPRRRRAWAWPVLLAIVIAAAGLSLAGVFTGDGGPRPAGDVALPLTVAVSVSQMPCPAGAAAPCVRVSGRLRVAHQGFNWSRTVTGVRDGSHDCVSVRTAGRLAGPGGLAVFSGAGRYCPGQEARYRVTLTRSGSLTRLPAKAWLTYAAATGTDTLSPAR